MHRDINPANILRRDSDGALLLIDFGSVRKLAHAVTDGSTITGTVGFMAPEQLWGRASAATDFYGVGMTMLWLKLGGQLPEGLRTEDGKLASTLLLGSLRNVLERLTATDSSRRPQTATAALHLLEKTPQHALTPAQMQKLVTTRSSAALNQYSRLPSASARWAVAFVALSNVMCLVFMMRDPVLTAVAVLGLVVVGKLAVSSYRDR